MSGTRTIGHAAGLVAAGLALVLTTTLAVLVVTTPAARAEVKARADKVGDAWVETDLLQMKVNNGRRRVWARITVDHLKRRGKLWVTFWNGNDGGNLFVKPGADGVRTPMWRTRNGHDKRVPCASSHGAWNLRKDYVAVRFRHGCLRQQDRGWFAFSFHVYDYERDGHRWIADSSDKGTIQRVEKG